jgi:glycosyltransferase involved in cell wall biosynthesis
LGSLLKLKGQVLGMRIVCVHQGYELYGSDRCFVESVGAIRETYPDADIEIVLCKVGPIVELVSVFADRVVFEPLWILRRSNILALATIGLFRFPAALARALLRWRSSDLVYINTSVILDYIFAARFFRRRSLLHIHEIPQGLALQILRGLVSWSGPEIIFNSNATRSAFALSKNHKSHVIYNGITGPIEPEQTDYDGNRPLRLLMLGRINRIKGQEVLIRAVQLLPMDVRERLDVRIIGSAFEDKEAERAISKLVLDAALEKTIKIDGFVNDTMPLYRWADIVVVPSKLPEPLGRVAIEAMSFGRPVIASEIGGLPEVVKDQVTGWLIPPGDPTILAGALRWINERPQSWREFGTAGRRRYEELFSAESVRKALSTVIQSKLK